mmetsp:Transcript_4988/g.10093  ORF Transcript_4988/g.10093 Transcript_4988/m.10093 type:complete len:400 (-) Transcript_4988:234-1433(-)
MSTSQDPSGFLPAANGGKPPLLKLMNISARPELNDSFGQAVSFSSDRYVVALVDATTAAAAVRSGSNSIQPTFLRLKPENLARATQLDQFKLGALTAFQAAKMYLNDPSVQSFVTSNLPPALRARLTPQQAILCALAVIMLALFTLWKIVANAVGFTKLFMVASLLGFVLTVSMPDWSEAMKQRKPLKLTIQRAAANFTTRWKENLIYITGRPNISDTVAKASLLFILLWSGKVILTPTPAKYSAPPVNVGQSKPFLQNSFAISSNEIDLEQIYKLGFDDARSGREFGLSLHDGIAAFNAAQEERFRLQENNRREHYIDDSNLDWAYNPQPPPKTSRFGMGTILSLFALFNFGKDLVTSPDGQVVMDVNYIVMRLRSTEPWRLGLLLISLYRVISALFF